MTHILDAMDELSRARDLVHLIAMTAAHALGEDQKAISTGCETIEVRLQAAFQYLEQAKEPTEPACSTGSRQRSVPGLNANA